MAMLASRCAPEAPKSPGRDPIILPTLFGEGQGLYRIQQSTFLLSFLLHVLAVLLLFTSGTFLVAHRQQIQKQVVEIVSVPISCDHQCRGEEPRCWNGLIARRCLPTFMN